MSALGDALLVGLGGFIGSTLRFALSGWVYRFLPFGEFPYGTLAVNVLGCLTIGVLGGVGEFRGELSSAQRLFVLVGILGGFTTFSTFAYETFLLARETEFERALANTLLSVVLGFGAAWLGYATVRSL